MKQTLFVLLSCCLLVFVASENAAYKDCREEYEEKTKQSLEDALGDVANATNREELCCFVKCLRESVEGKVPEKDIAQHLMAAMAALEGVKCNYDCNKRTGGAADGQQIRLIAKRNANDMNSLLNNVPSLPGLPAGGVPKVVVPEDVVPKVVVPEVVDLTGTVVTPGSPDPASKGGNAAKANNAGRIVNPIWLMLTVVSVTLVKMHVNA